MKVDIKSFLIGILTTVNLFLLMGFDDHEEESQIGRYQAVVGGNTANQLITYDTTNGEYVKIRGIVVEANKEIFRNPNRLETFEEMEIRLPKKRKVKGFNN